MDPTSYASKQLVSRVSGDAVRQRHAVSTATRTTGAQVCLGSAHRRLPGNMRDIRLYFPRHAVSGTDARAWFHRRTVHSRLLSIPGIFTARCYAERGYEIACCLFVGLSVRL